MNPVGESATAEEYHDFGTRQAADSPCFTAWALGVADDPEVLALLEGVPPGKRQPNLVFAAARWHGARLGPYDGLRSVLTGRWEQVRSTVLSRATQTNEPGRCATLLPVLASLPGPLALLEVGCSAGLCLFPDRYSYRFSTPRHLVSLDPPGGPSPVVLDCEVLGDAPLPRALPDVVWRGGIDVNPLDVGDDDAMRWLRTLVWPEHEDRRARLAAAVALAREDPPWTVRSIVRGDLLEELPGLVEQVPDDATLVVFHSAVIAYLADRDRVRFTEMMPGLRGHWLSNEGTAVLPGLSPPPRPTGSPVGADPLVMALDGRPVAWAHGHGRAVHWIEEGAAR